MKTAMKTLEQSDVNSFFVQKKWLKGKNGKEDGGFALVGNAKA